MPFKFSKHTGSNEFKGQKKQQWCAGIFCCLGLMGDMFFFCLFLVFVFFLFSYLSVVFVLNFAAVFIPEMFFILRNDKRWRNPMCLQKHRDNIFIGYDQYSLKAYLLKCTLLISYFEAALLSPFICIHSLNVALNHPKSLAMNQFLVNSLALYVASENWI